MNLTPSVHGSVRRRTAVLALAGLLVLASCGGEDVDAVATTTTLPVIATTQAPTTAVPITDAPSTTAAPTTAAPSTAAPTTAPSTAAPTTAPGTAVSTTAAPTTAAPTTAPPRGVDCLIGDWVVTDEALDEYFEFVLDETTLDSIENDGVIRYSFTEDVYLRELDATVAMTFDGSEYVAVHAIATRQPYAVVDGELTSAGPPSYVGDSTFTKDGQPITEDLGDLFVGVIPAPYVEELSYSCDGPTLIVPAGPNPDVTYRLPLEPA